MDRRHACPPRSSAGRHRLFDVRRCAITGAAMRVRVTQARTDRARAFRGARVLSLRGRRPPTQLTFSGESHAIIGTLTLSGKIDIKLSLRCWSATVFSNPAEGRLSAQPDSFPALPSWWNIGLESNSCGRRRSRAGSPLPVKDTASERKCRSDGRGWSSRSRYHAPRPLARQKCQFPSWAANRRAD